MGLFLLSLLTVWVLGLCSPALARKDRLLVVAMTRNHTFCEYTRRLVDYENTTTAVADSPENEVSVTVLCEASFSLRRSALFWTYFGLFASLRPLQRVYDWLVILRPLLMRGRKRFAGCGRESSYFSSGSSIEQYGNILPSKLFDRPLL